MQEKMDHTRNLIIGLTVLVLLFCLAVWVAVWTYTLLLQIKSLDAVIIVALITGIASFACVFVSKFLDRGQQRQKYLNEKREDVYKKVLQVFYKTLKSEHADVVPATCPNENMTDVLFLLSEELTMWGSSNVINEWLKFRKITTAEKPDTKEVLFVYESIIFAIRKDLGISNYFLKKGDLLRFVINDIDDVLKPPRGTP